MSDVATTARSIRTRLGRLRARIRAIFAVVGISRWVIALVAVVLGFFAADYFLDLPLGVRQFVRLGLFDKPLGMSIALWLPALAACIVLALAFTRSRRGAAPFFAFLAAGIVGLLAWVAVRVFFPMRVRLPDDDLALSVEARFRGLKDRLAAALDFSRELDDPVRGESEVMMRAVVAEADDEARSLRFSKAASGKRALQWGAAAVGVLLLAGGTTAWASDSFNLFVRRSLMLEDLEWPRATTLLAVDVAEDGTVTTRNPNEPFSVSVGRSLTLFARAEGTVPDEVYLVDLIDGQQPLPRRMFRAPDSEDVFAFEFRDVRRPFRFVLQGGDDEDEKPVYSVEITVPPKMLTVRSEIHFPDYLNKEPEKIEDGNVRVPEGSRVDVVFDTDLPVVDARVTFGDSRREIEPDDEARDGGHHAFKFSYTADRSVTYRINLRTADGRTNDPTRNAYRVTVLRDQPPRVSWTWPRGLVEVSSKGHVPLLVQARDDHAVMSLTLERRLGDDDIVSYPLTRFVPDDVGDDTVPFRTETVDGEFGRQRVLAFVPIDVERIKGKDGASVPEQGRVAFRWKATDSRGQVRESDWGSIDVFPEAELERGLATRRAGVRATFEAVLRDQIARHEDVKSVLEEANLGEGERDLLKSVRFRQGRIAQDADRGAQDLIAVFNAFVYGRLGSPVPNGKIIAYLDRHHRDTYGVRAAERERQAAWEGDPVFPYALYDRIVDAWEKKAIYDRGVLERMLAAMRDAVEAASRSAPAVHKAAAAAVDGDRAAVEALRKAQEAHLDVLQRLKSSITSWQTLADVTEALRGLVEDHRSFVDQLDRAAQDDDDN